ncbi:hypothetical protein ACFZDK_25315 [Streptomyces sp. NPDC007901]|uniref:hypothetical protein n=1 Tax=Streptomyces sp. NPDC007901 TaxID=3364785 RepID=UPI0036ED8D76
MLLYVLLPQPLSTGRRFGAGFFGAGFFGAGAGLWFFLTGTILWKLMVLFLSVTASAGSSVLVLQQFFYRSAAMTCELI